MDNDEFFEKLENTIKNLGDSKLPKTLKVTITYSTGEKEVLNESEIFWAKTMVATKNRNKYMYIQKRLINLDHVVKIHYEKLEANT